MHIKKNLQNFKNIILQTQSCVLMSVSTKSRLAENQQTKCIRSCLHVMSFSREKPTKRCLLNLIPRLSASADKNNGGQILAAKQSYSEGSGKYLRSFQSNWVALPTCSFRLLWNAEAHFSTWSVLHCSPCANTGSCHDRLYRRFVAKTSTSALDKPTFLACRDVDKHCVSAFCDLLCKANIYFQEFSKYLGMHVGQLRY